MEKHEISSGYSLNFISHSIESKLIAITHVSTLNSGQLPVYSCTVSSILFFQLKQIPWRGSKGRETHVFYVTQTQELTIFFSFSIFYMCYFCVTFCVFFFSVVQICSLIILQQKTIWPIYTHAIYIKTLYPLTKSLKCVDICVTPWVYVLAHVRVCVNESLISKCWCLS